MSKAQTEPVANHEWLTRKQVLAFFGGIHSSTLDRGIRAGRFPFPYRFGDRSRRWSRRECEAALAALQKKSP